MIERSVLELRSRECASKYGVSPEIHDRDYLFQYLVNRIQFAASPIAAVDEYFSHGRWFADQFDELVSKILRPTALPIDVLEFASGYGRVSPHLHKMRGKYRVLACDTHPQAVAFLENRLGVPSILSHKNPECLAIGRQFEVVFALSFFTHLPDATWGRWLRKLFDLVSEGGLLIFTAHGRSIASIWGNPTLREDGYWFTPQSEQRDLTAKEYGTTISTFPYVFGKLQDADGARLVFYQERHWGDFQDTYVIQKSVAGEPLPGAAGPRPAPSARSVNRELFAKGLECLRAEGIRSTALRVRQWIQRR